MFKVLVGLGLCVLVVFTFLSFPNGSDGVRKGDKGSRFGDGKNSQVPAVITPLSPYRFVSLPEPVVAQSGGIEVLRSEITDPGIEALKVERSEAMVAFLYKKASDQETSSPVLPTAAPTRPLKEVLNQYGVPWDDGLTVEFFKNDEAHREKEFLKGASTFLPLARIETQIFQRQMEKIQFVLAKKSLQKQAQELNQPPGQQLTQGESQNYGRNYDRNQRKIQGQNRIQKNFVRWQTLADEILKKQGLKMSMGRKGEKQLVKALGLTRDSAPILVGLKPPQSFYDIQWEWTPGLGAKHSEKSYSVIVASDFRSQSGRTLLGALPNLSEKYPHVRFGFRPYFPKKDRFQMMTANFCFCLWVHSPEKFWQGLRNLFRLPEVGYESELFARLDSLSLVDDKVKNIKNCFYQQDHLQAVQYHLDYGEYLGIQSLPTVFSGGEVFQGSVALYELEQSIERMNSDGLQPTIPEKLIKTPIRGLANE